MRALAAVLLTAAALTMWLPPAGANCHIATWDRNRITVGEDVRFAELFIELDGDGRVTCTGSVRWTTSNGSATAPADYTASKGEESWKPGSERRRTIRIPILKDSVAETKGETFHVTMTAGPGGIQVEQVGPGEGGPVADVLIKDVAATPSSSVPSSSATPAPSLTPTASSPGTNAAAPDKGGSTGLIVGIVAGVLVVGALPAMLLKRRRT